MSTSLPPSKPPADIHPMQALLDQEGFEVPKRGDIREGTVISVSPQEVIIDLGVKREGIVPANDLSRLEDETREKIQEGSTWPVYILQPSDREGNLIVSISRAMQEKDWLIAQERLDSNEIFEGEVSGHNSGGLEVVFGKLRGFVPASHISTLPRGISGEERKDQLAAFVGQTLPLKVIEVDRRRRRLIMSERAAHRRWQREHRKQLLDDLEVGEVRNGVVRSLANFGVFVDIGGADGLIHISELAWFPVGHPSEVIKVGERIDVKVLRVDKQRERIGLSLKRCQPDPWSHVADDYKVDELVEAVVTRVTDFGAFVRLRSGVEGLLHVSEMADIRPDHPQSLVSPGDLLLLRVLRIESERRRIGLSLRQVSEAEWAEWAASYRERHAAAEEAEAEVEVEAVAAEAEAEVEVEAVAAEAEAEVEVEAVAAEAEGEVEAEVAEAEAEVAEAEAAVEVAEAEAAVEVAEAAVEVAEAEAAVEVEAFTEAAEAAETVAAEAIAEAEAVVEAAATETVVAEFEAVSEEAVAEEAAEAAEAVVAEVEAVSEEAVAEAAETAEVVVAEAVVEEAEAEVEVEAAPEEAVAETTEATETVVEEAIAEAEAVEEAAAEVAAAPEETITEAAEGVVERAASEVVQAEETAEKTLSEQA